MDGIIFPSLVKKREISSPRSPFSAISSPGRGLRTSTVLGIERLLFSGRSPKRYQVAELAFLILPNLKNQRKQPLPNPTHCAELFGDLGAPILIVRMEENLLDFLKADPAIFPQSLALAWIEVKPH